MGDKFDLRQWAEELYKPARKPKAYRKIVTAGILDVMCMDLVDIQAYREENDNMGYLLMALDAFSRKLWAIPLASKKPDVTWKAFQTILDEGAEPNKIWTDQGGEFVNALWKKQLKAAGIAVVHTFSDSKSSLVERVNGTIKRWLYKEMAIVNSFRWVDFLPRVVDKYNNSRHRALGMSPNEAFKKENEVALWEHQYGDVAAAPIAPEPDLKVGDTVRVSKVKGKFHRAFDIGWSMEVFKVARINRRRAPALFYLVDGLGEDVEGGFYREELQKVKQPDLTLIDKVIKFRQLKGKEKEAFVSWRGYPAKFNEWVPAKGLYKV